MKVKSEKLNVKHGSHTSNAKGKGQNKANNADDAGREPYFKNEHF